MAAMRDYTGTGDWDVRGAKASVAGDDLHIFEVDVLVCFSCFLVMAHVSSIGLSCVLLVSHVRLVCLNLCGRKHSCVTAISPLCPHDYN